MTTVAMPKREYKWMVGLTTVPQRLIDHTTSNTVDNINSAGFSVDHIFTDDGVGAFGRWVLGLWELYLRNPKADYYAIFQDDIILSKNIRQYIEAWPFPRDGYGNLYIAGGNRPFGGTIGWTLPRHRGEGALALVFPLGVVIELLSSPEIVNHPQARNGDRNIDGIVTKALYRKGYNEYVHNPSLVQHVGTESVIGNEPRPISDCFRGPQFDALDLIKERQH